MAFHDALLFDLDGVLIDSRIPFARCINAALLANGFAERPEDQLRRYIGPPLHSTFSELTGDPALVQGCVDAYRARYRQFAVTETTVADGMDSLLASLTGTVPMLVATSKPLALAEPLLGSLGLLGYFDGVVGPSLTAENESKSETVGRALQRLRSAERPVMVGDRKYDIVAAHDHGLRAVGVLWGIGSEQELRIAGADHLVASPAELALLLEL